MSDKNKKRKITDKYYYRFKVLLKNPKLKKGVNKLLGHFEKFGCGIPGDGFKNWQEVEEWRKKLCTKHTEIVRSQKYQEERKKIVGNKTHFTPEEFCKLEKWEEENAPPVVWMNEIENILVESGFDKKDETNKKFLRNFILFKRLKDPRIIFKLRLTRNKKTQEPEVWVRIFPYTLKPDICSKKAWNLINDCKKSLPEYIGKSKQRENFERDFGLYKIFREALKECNGSKKQAFKLIQDKLDYTDKLLKIDKEEKLSEENLRKIIERYHQILQDIEVL